MTYLRGESEASSAFLHDPAWYEDNAVQLLLGTSVTGVMARDRAVELAGGGRLRYDSLLVATGGRNRRLSVHGHDLEGIHELRTLEDADRIRAAARPGARAVVVGAGFIGCEVAASLRTLGVEVEIVEVLDVPLLRAAGPEVGRVLEGIHRDRGVSFHLGQVVDRFEGSGRVEAVVTAGGTRIECDFVAVGIGIVPNVGVVGDSGIDVDNGILVDEFCRTNVEGVYAAGDVANHYHPMFGRRHRVEHWDNALKQGAAAARSILGRPEPFDDPHWFWSDQYEYNLQSVGDADACDQLVVRGSLEDRDFVVFHLKDGAVRGAVGLNRGRDVKRAAALVSSGRTVDPAALRDLDVDLKKLAASLREA